MHTCYMYMYVQFSCLEYGVLWVQILPKGVHFLAIFKGPSSVS